MDSELLSVAYRLVEHGWLPGIVKSASGLDLMVIGRYRQDATEADFVLAAHNEFRRRGWQYDVMPETDEIVVKDRTAADGTDTLALLRCLLAACEAAEKDGKR